MRNPSRSVRFLVRTKPPPKHRRRRGYADSYQGHNERGFEMTEKTAAAAAVAPVPATKLEPDAIGVAQDTVIGMASSAPAASVGLTLAALAANAAYGSLPIIILTALPMIIIAYAYRRLNLWNANCGASFEWVGRAINPYLGFITGWLMLAGTLFGTLTPVTAIGPSVLAVFNPPANSKWPNILLATGLVRGVKA